MAEGTHSGRIKTSDTVFDILEALATGEERTITEITEQVDVSKGTVHAHLQTLKDRGYLVQTDSKAYRLGLLFLSFGGHVRNTHYKRLYWNAKTELDTLADDTGERAQVMVEENGFGIYLYQAVGRDAVMTDSHLGMPTSLHATASGKAYLSHRPREEVERILDQIGLPAHTQRTITDRETFLELLDDVRERGVAYDRGERVTGIRCIGVPVLSDTGETLGAISMSAPAQRMEAEGYEDEITDRLKNIARVIGLNTTYS